MFAWVLGTVRLRTTNMNTRNRDWFHLIRKNEHRPLPPTGTNSAHDYSTLWWRPTETRGRSIRLDIGQPPIKRSAAVRTIRVPKTFAAPCASDCYVALQESPSCSSVRPLPAPCVCRQGSTRSAQSRPSRASHCRGAASPDRSFVQSAVFGRPKRTVCGDTGEKVDV